MLLNENLIETELNQGQLELLIDEIIIRDLKIEDEIDEEAIAIIESYSRKILPGSEEWDLKFRKHKEEVANRKGYVF
jgi:hypothetical protein